MSIERIESPGALPSTAVLQQTPASSAGLVNAHTRDTLSAAEPKRHEVGEDPHSSSDGPPLFSREWLSNLLSPILGEKRSIEEPKIERDNPFHSLNQEERKEATRFIVLLGELLQSIQEGYEEDFFQELWDLIERSHTETLQHRCLSEKEHLLHKYRNKRIWDREKIELSEELLKSLKACRFWTTFEETLASLGLLTTGVTLSGAAGAAMGAYALFSAFNVFCERAAEAKLAEFVGWGAESLFHVSRENVEAHARTCLQTANSVVKLAIGVLTLRTGIATLSSGAAQLETLRRKAKKERVTKQLHGVASRREEHMDEIDYLSSSLRTRSQALLDEQSRRSRRMDKLRRLTAEVLRDIGE